MSAPAPSTALPDTPPCPRHPSHAAVGTCARCGGFYCEAEALQHGAHTYCEACGHLPEVSHLERMRQKLWGKRDGWAWLMLASAPLHLTSVGKLFAAALTGQMSVEQALQAAQQSTAREMKRAGYPK